MVYRHFILLYVTVGLYDGRPLGSLCVQLVCVPRMGIEDDQSGYCYKDSDGTGNFLLLGDESSPHAKASMRVASRKGFHREVESEVSGTAKAGMYEQKSHRRHLWAVEVAHHTEGRTYSSP